VSRWFQSITERNNRRYTLTQISVTQAARTLGLHKVLEPSGHKQIEERIR